MHYYSSWILLLLFLPFNHGFSQEKWTLDRCIVHAYENNIQLKQQELTISLAENNLFRSKMELLPGLAAGASQTNRFGRSVDPLTYEFTTENSKGSSFYGTTGLDLFNGFRGINAIKRDKLNLDIRLADFESAKNDLALNITRFYLQILFNKELEGIALEQVELTKLQVKTISRLYESGSLTKGELLEMQAQQAGEELNLVNAQNLLRLSLLNLAQLLDIEDIDGFDIEEPAFDNVQVADFQGSVNEIYQSAIALMPQIKSATLQLEYFEKDLMLARGLLSPSLSMNASWGSGYSDRIFDFQNNIMPFKDQFEFASTTSIGFNLRIPIFNNWAYKTDIKNSQLALTKSAFQLDLTKNQLRKEIQQAMADAQAALEKYRATEKSLISLQEAFMYTEKKHSAGLLTSLDYNMAKNNLTKAQSDLLQAKYNFIFNIRILDFYRGIPIELR